jgi:hypothetical protein
LMRVLENKPIAKPLEPDRLSWEQEFGGAQR